jgi:hypothetical protein
MTVLGSGFATGGDASKVLDILPADDKITVTNVVVVDSGKITADVKAATDTALGARIVGVTNSADSGFGSCACVYVAKVPSTPVLTLTAGAGSLTASWPQPSSNGAPITGYHVTLQRSGTATVVSRDLNASTRTTTFTGLVNGATYVVKVTAANAAGISAAASKTGIPGLFTSFLGISVPKTASAGVPMTFSGRLMHGSVGVPGRTIKLTIYQSIGSTLIRTTTTTSTGSWAYQFTPRYHTAVVASFAGDSIYRGTTGPLLHTVVASRVIRTSPASGSHTASSTLLTIRGYVYPNHAGTYVYLYRFVGSTKTLVNRVKLSSTSTFAFSGRPKKGTYTFRVYIPTTKGNAAAYSAPFVIYRT